MTEKKAEPAYIITESELRQIGDAVHEYGIIGAVPLFLKIRSRPHNPTLAIISVEPHPPGKEQLACDNTCPARCPGCEDTCPLWEHDEQVKREAREEVLDKMRDLVRNAKKYGTIEPEELFHWTGIITMIDSLRSEVKNP